MSSSPVPTRFQDLALAPSVLKALNDVGYETPTPIQAQTIPLMLNGRDVLGQAQTGTGKTAAFALPILSRIDLSKLQPQVLVLAPTRELAIQVAEAFQRYAAHLDEFHVLPIYGGQEYRIQLRQLKRGVHVVVGTPGRVMDHMRRKTLNLDGLICLVLDEADEMLRMGFIDDVEWILEQTPEQRQIALFSATLPQVIRRIAQKYLQDPEQVTIKLRTSTAETIRQRFWMVSGMHKLDALTRILEVESFDGIIVFVRTKTATLELAERLEARGFAAVALNGDIAQKQRERTIEQLKAGKLDILVATDVAARGLDVERISHVINYDIPHDTESYVHRIGRTGRAGRTGEAILFVAPRERRMLHNIERATKQKIAAMELPSTEVINDKRISRFKQQITEAIATEGLEFYHQLIEQYQQEHNIPAIEIAAALAKKVQGDEPLLLTASPSKRKPRRQQEFDDRGDNRSSRKRQHSPKDQQGKIQPKKIQPKKIQPKKIQPKKIQPKKIQPKKIQEGMERYRIEVGHVHDVKPGNIVGAIANEAGLDSEYIGRIDIWDDYSLVDLPEGMPKETFRTLQRAWVVGRQLQLSRFQDDGEHRGKVVKKESVKRKPKSKEKKKKQRKRKAAE